MGRHVISSRTLLTAAVAVAGLGLLAATAFALIGPSLALGTTSASILAADGIPGPQVTTVAEFPSGSFLENVTVRADGSMLVTELNKKQLWYVPAPAAGSTVQPVLLHTFDQPPFDVVEMRPDVYYVDTSDYLASHQSNLVRIDLRGWAPGLPVQVQPVLKFPFPLSAVNGASALSPTVLLVADSLLGLIWRVDLSADGTEGSARVWLKDSSMNLNPLSRLKAPQPGINGLGYAARTHYLYYTSTAQRLFMRVPVNPSSLDPSGEPELVARGSLWDDFDIDENAGVAYVTTHRQNTIERIPLDPHGTQARRTLLGIPFDGRLVGPSRFVWGRGATDYGSVAYVTTDGGVTAPPADGIVRPAKILRIVLSTGGDT